MIHRVRASGKLRWIVGLVLLTGSLASLWASPTPASAFTPNPASDGLSNLASCYRQTGKMAVELLIDQTGSLHQTDPQGRRVELAQSVSQALAEVANVPVGGVPGQVDIQAVGFGTGVYPVIPWQGLTPSNVGSFGEELSQFATRNSDLDTDYVTALTQARQDVLAQAGAMDPTNPSSVCRVVVWFTDGQFDFEPHGIQPSWAGGLTVNSAATRAQALALGTNLLCSSGGIADTYRSTPIFLLTVGLSTVANPLPAPAQNLLNGVTTGPPGSSCGSIPGTPTGWFLSGSIDDLVNGLVPSVIADPPPTPMTAQCAAGGLCQVPFRVYSTTSTAVLMVSPTSEGKLDVVSPTGQSYDISPTEVEQSSPGIRLQSSSAGLTRFVTISLEDNSPAGVGAWMVQLVPTASASLSVRVYLQTGISLVPSPSAPWTRGKADVATFALVRNNMPLPVSDVSSADLAGTVALGSGTPTAVSVAAVPGTNTFRLSFDPPIDDPSSSATINVSGTVTLSGGAGVIPVDSSADLAIVVSGAPVAPTSLDLGALTAQRSGHLDSRHQEIGDRVEVHRYLVVRGSTNGNGQFCVAPSSQIMGATGPSGAIAPGAGPCVNVPAGQVRRIPIVVTLAHPIDGPLVGTLIATTKWDAASNPPTQIHIPVIGNVVVPPGNPIVDQSTFWLLVLGSLLAAAALWIGLCWYTARLKEPTLIKGFRVAVTAGPPGSNFALPTLSRNDFSFLSSTGGSRSARLEDPGHNHRDTEAGLGDLELRAPVRVFTAQDIVVRLPGHLVHGRQGADRRHKSLEGRIGHQIWGEWAFAIPLNRHVDENPPSLSGDLYLFVLDDKQGEEGDPRGLLDRACRELGDHFDEITKRMAVVDRGGSEEPRQPALVEEGSRSDETFGLY